jgi:hypothetical protein
MPLGFRPERAFRLAEIPQLPLQERFKSSLSQRADRLRTGSGLPQRWYELTERTPRPRFDFAYTAPISERPTIRPERGAGALLPPSLDDRE